MTRTHRIDSAAASLRLASLLVFVPLVLLVPRADAGQDPGQGAGKDAPFTPQTRVSLRDGFWHINGKPTHPGSDAEGLLMNVRMVNATFEDRNPETCPKGFDPDANTTRFLAALPDYVAHGVSAFTLCLQGGSPNYEGALNSAFARDGTLRPAYMKRVARVIEACDRAGVGVILGLFYQRQDQVLEDEAAVKRAVVNAASWVKARGYTNVLLEIANEHQHGGFDHEIIQVPESMATLIELARTTAPGVLVAASGMGNGRVRHPVGNASDFILLHFNSIPVELILARIAPASKYAKAIVCNEDDKVGETGARAAQAAVDGLCSWGYMNKEKNQYHPFEFEGAKDDPVVYARLKKLTSK